MPDQPEPLSLLIPYVPQDVRSMSDEDLTRVHELFGEHRELVRRYHDPVLREIQRRESEHAAAQVAGPDAIMIGGE